MCIRDRQLDAYKYIIEKYYMKRVSAMYIVGLHPDNGSEPFVDEVPCLDVEINALMEEQRRRASEVLGFTMNDFVSRDPLGGGSNLDDSQADPEEETQDNQELAISEVRHRMPADGLCLYHAYNAALNLTKWKALTEQQKLILAHVIRERMIATTTDNNVAERLSNEGPDGYPSTDDFEYLTMLLKEDRGADLTVTF